MIVTVHELVKSFSRYAPFKTLLSNHSTIMTTRAAAEASTDTATSLAALTTISVEASADTSTSIAAMTTRAAAEKASADIPEEQESPTKQHSRRFENALSFLKRIDSTTSLRGNIKFHLAVDEIVKYSMSQGLEPAQIVALVDVVVNSKTKLSQAIRSKFVKCLVPSSKVPQAVIVRVLSFISSKIFTDPGPSNLHSLLLRWILLVFDYIDGYDQLHKLYTVVFCLINSHRLLPHACHLLFLLTTKQDVKLFRVQKLLEIVKSLGPEPYVMGLLMIYKVYCPHLVSMKLSFGNKVFFKAHDHCWRSTIAAVVKQRNEADDLEAMQKVSEIQLRREKARIQPRAKRQKLMVPETHSAAHEIDDDEADVESQDPLQGNNKIPFTQIESFTGFLESIDKIEFPSQVAACLADTRLQLMLTSNPDPLVLARLCFWIHHIFTFGFKTTDKGSKERNEKLLLMLFTFSKNVQGLPLVFGFLESFLLTWDGQSYAPLIFSLITCVRPCSYSELHSCILQPLQRVFYSSDVYSKTMCISALTKLIRNLALEGRSNTVSSVSSTSSVGQPQTSLGSQTEEADQQGSSSQEPAASSHDEGIADTVYGLIKFLDVVLVVGMRMEDDHYLLQTSSLDLLQLISELYIKYTIPLICLPMRLIHRLLLSDSSASLARLCGIINTFREAFIIHKSNKKTNRRCSLTCATTDLACGKPENTGTETFNALLMDVLGMLWQGNMFTDRKHKYESFFRVQPTPHLEGKLKDNSLTIYQGPAFLGLAYKFLKETQREGKRVHPSQIEEHKEIYLQFLTRENLPEFMQLVNTNIKFRKNRV